MSNNQVQMAKIAQAPLAQPSGPGNLRPYDVQHGNDPSHPAGLVKAGEISLMQSLHQMGMLNAGQVRALLQSDPYLATGILQYAQVFAGNNEELKDKYREEYGTGLSGALSLAQRQKVATELLRDLNSHAQRQLANRGLRGNIQFA